MSALAMAIRCFWPPDSCVPVEETELYNHNIDQLSALLVVLFQDPTISPQLMKPGTLCSR